MEDSRLIGFNLELDDLIEKMKYNLPEVDGFPEITQLHEYFSNVESDINDLKASNKECHQMLDELFHEHLQRPSEHVEVLKISDDESDNEMQLHASNNSEKISDKDILKSSYKTQLPAAPTQFKRQKTTATPPRKSPANSSLSPENELIIVGDNLDDLPPKINPVPQASVDTKNSADFINEHYMIVHDSKVFKFNIARKMRILGMKLSGLWYKGTVQNILERDKHIDQWKYRVNFDTKGSKTLTGKEMALLKPTPRLITVGSRVCAVYSGELNGKYVSKTAAYYGGIVVEPPTLRNRNRFLVFFEDGYAQYCPQNDVFKVIVQNRDVWKDINPDSQEFIKEYLEQYPERPMVRLSASQILKTEYDGKWWTTKVIAVDGSLVKMLFLDDRRTEWIYRGSTRLEPLYTERAKTEELRQLNFKTGRTNTTPGSTQKKKPIVEYPQIDDVITIDIDKKRPVARKSTSALNNKTENMSKLQYSSVSSYQPKTPEPTDIPRRFISVDNSMDTESLGHLKVDTRTSDPSRHVYAPHICSPRCLRDLDDKHQHKGENPFTIPMKCGWERHIAKVKSVIAASKRHVFYKTPCGRRLRTKREIDLYLLVTDSSLTIDLFTCDPSTHTHTEFLPVKTFCDIKDLTYSKENVPLPCVNGVDKQMPDFIKYSTERKPTKDVPMNLDQDFLVCCECTDNCRDSSKCACIQLTIEASAAANGGKKDHKAGYTYRCLRTRIVSGIFECNPRCNCDSRCHNRVVQNGLERRLQVYRTEKRGWGLRCLNDIPTGGFVCYYAGEILTSLAANEDGTVFGDEYLAELDYIEVVEQMKEGYESDVEESESDSSVDERSGAKSDSNDEEEFDENISDSDSSYSGGKTAGKKLYEKRTLPNRSKKVSKKGDEGKNGSDKSSKQSSKNNKKIGSDKGNNTESKDNPLPSSQKNKLSSTADWVNDLNADVIVIDSDDDDDVPMVTTGNKTGKDVTMCARKKTNMKDKPSRFKNLPDPKQKTTSPPKPEESFRSVRTHFKDGVDVYVIDAKAYGNLGRYLNHSCSPNTYVQNVFVDTHDPRFPWVAFFASKYIRAGSELTWDYSYIVDSVPGKVLYCYCGSPQCRGRLL